MRRLIFALLGLLAFVAPAQAMPDNAGLPKTYCLYKTADPTLTDGEVYPLRCGPDGNPTGSTSLNTISTRLGTNADGPTTVVGWLQWIGQLPDAVFGPTANGLPAATPPVLMGGTADGSATGTVRNQKTNSSGESSVAPGNTQNTTPWLVGSLLLAPSSSFTRPNDTTAYATGDLVANSATAGSVTPLSFTSTRNAAGNASILKATLKASNTALVSDTFILHLYGASPTPTNGDNGAFLTTESSWICDITITTNTYAFSDGVDGQGVPNAGNSCNFILASGTTVYGLLETRQAYTPTAQGTHTVALEVIAN